LIFNEKQIHFSPSLICMDLLNARQEIEVLNQYFDYIHFDVMDGHFCKSMALSPRFLHEVRTVTPLPIDVHLMVSHPEDFIDDVLCQSDIVTLHIESITTQAFRLISKIKDAGKQVGIAICPATLANSLEYVIENIDYLTVLGVDVGYVGQPLIDSTYRKIRTITEMRAACGRDFLIQCDGGVRAETFSRLLSAGADMFVLGKVALFGKHDNLSTACNIMGEEFTQVYELERKSRQV